MLIQQRIDWLKSCTERQRKNYYAAVVKVGCIACGAPYTPEGPNRTSLHHATGANFPAKRNHRPVLPLCWTKCHQYGRMSVHGGKASFEAEYGSQTELAERVEGILEKTTIHTEQPN